MTSRRPPESGPASFYVRDSLPIVQRIVTSVPGDEVRRLSAIAEGLLRNEPALNATDSFGARIEVGVAKNRPALLLADHSEIALYDLRGDMSLEYRMLLLAQPGDIAVIGTQRSRDFEAYCRDRLGIGPIDVIALPDTNQRPRPGPAKRCYDNAKLLSSLVETARRHRGLTVLPYMGTGWVWMLAAEIASRANVTIHVAAPPPRLVRRVNDKLWFAERVREVIGGAALPPSYSSYGPAALAARVAALARDHPQVVVKLPDSASGSGNLVLPSPELRAMPLADLHQHLITLLEGLGWRGAFPLLAGVWDSPVVANPSVQLWIPLLGDGSPVIEGVFDQYIEGPKARFVGASLSRLPDPWQQRIADEAARLATLFQALGYFGRCSLDAVLAGESLGKATLHWIECNGRWGGTSLPMSIANRLVPGWQRCKALIVQRPLKLVPGCTFASVAERLDRILLAAGDRDWGIVFLSPGGIEQGTGLNMLVFADTDAQLDEFCQAVADAVG